jgi:hypothetical protein
MKPGNYWAAWLVFALGVWELFAPFIWKYGNHFTMTGNSAVVGVLIMMFGFWVVATDHDWASWVNVALGVWLIVAAVVFERGLGKALVNDVVVGALVVGFAYLAARHGKAAWARGWPVIERGEGHLSR